jgi:hypothetical protein
MAHAQKAVFILLRLNYDGTWEEIGFHLTAFEM